RRVDEAAAVAKDPKTGAEQRLRGRRTEAHERVRLHDVDLRLEPGQARADLRDVGRAMQPPLAPRHPLEVLHDVRDIDVAALDACRLERVVEQLSGGPDERSAGEILAVSRHLAD